MAIFGKKQNNEKENKDAKEIKEVKEEAEVKAEAPAPAETAETPEANEAAERPKYNTPEGFDFNRYFLAERRIALENISYETTRPAQTQGQFKLGVKDTIVAQLIGQAGVKATYNRTLRFDPEGPFVLSVSFAVMLVFNPGTRGEVDWHTIDIADEFKKNCPALIQQMSAKAALLVAEITAANNGMPIIPIK